MSGLEYYTLDVEATGLNPNYHEVIEISIIRFVDKLQITRQIKAEFPQRADWKSLKIIGKKKSDLLFGDTKEKVITDVENFLAQDGKNPSQRCIIAFVAHFDRNFCYSLFASRGKEFPAHNWVDAKGIARLYAKKLGLEKPKLSLENTLNFSGITPIPGAHTARADTRNLHLFVKKAFDEKIDYMPLLKSVPHQLEKKADKLNWADLIEEVDDSNIMDISESD